MTQPLRQAPVAQPDQPGRPAPGRSAPRPLPLVRRWDLRAALMLSGLLAVWLFARPWDGLWHDGRLYAAQALRLLHPAEFSRDLFFLFGSQDAFTLFSPIYAGFIQALGLDAGPRLLQALGSLLWAASAAFLLQQFRRGLWAWLCLAALLLLPSDYDPVRAFGLAEPFLTPRMFGEALGMLAIGCLLRGWLLPAAAALVLGALLHPLMLMGVALFAMCYLAHAHGRPARSAAVVALLAAVLGAAALLGVAPFDRLLRTMDAVWYGQVVQTLPLVAWDSWRFEQMASRTAVSFALVLAAAWLSSGWRARFYWCIALTGAAGLLASWLGTSVIHNLLLLQLQPWRTQWLVQLGAVIALAWLAAAYWQRGRIFRVLLLVLAVAYLTRDSYGGLLAAAAALALCWQGRRAQALELPVRLYAILLGGVAVLALGWLANADNLAIQRGLVLHWNYADAESPASEFVWAVLHLGGAAMLGLALLALIWRGAGQRRWTGRLAAIVLAAGALAGALWLGQDYRAVQPKISAQARQALTAAFQPLVPRQATVYWHGHEELSWFLLQRSAYASRMQVFGMVFNRGTAVEGMRRLERLQQLGNSDFLFGLEPAERERRMAQLPRASAAGLAAVCADPALGFVVLEQRFGAAYLARVDDPDFDTSYYLYDCGRLRGGGA